MAEAWSVRELVGFAAWIEAETGYVTLSKTEDTRAPVEAYWGLSEGQTYQRTEVQSRGKLCTSVTVKLTIEVGKNHTYVLMVGTTPLAVSVLDTNVEADLPALVQAAFDVSTLALGRRGDDGLVLTSLDDTTYTLDGSIEQGGVPILQLGYGWSLESSTLTDEIYDITVSSIQHSIIATAWARVRGRGLACELCDKLYTATLKPQVQARVQRHTGQGLNRATLTPLDNSALLGGAESNMDVAQIELVTTAALVSVIIDPSVAEYVMTLIPLSPEVDPTP